MDRLPVGLIIGAGPVGLAAALFLRREGESPRIVELREEPTQNSRALAVNPRTLEILEPTGVTARMLELGLPVRGARFHRNGRSLAALSFAAIHPRYPFMLALSQASTERLLARALEERGGRVERGTRLTACRASGSRVEAVLERTAESCRESAEAAWLLAADGAHSTVRHELGIEFPGSAFARDWYLADVPLRTSLREDEAHVSFAPDGGLLFMIRVVDERLAETVSDPVWRLITNRPDPVSQLVNAEATGAPVWESAFHIAHRIASTLGRHGFYLAGDAAHIHSPMGARGMNLGIEDARVFASLATAGRLPEYDRLRRPVDARVVRQVELLSRVVNAESAPFRLARHYLLPLLLGIGPLRRSMMRTLTGLDHDLPTISGRTNAGTEHDAAGSSSPSRRRAY